MDEGNRQSLDTACESIANAFNRTIPGGEIDVLDSSEYYGQTINKSISIVNASDGVVRILPPFESGGNAITINAAPYDKVHLRGLTTMGTGLLRHRMALYSQQRQIPEGR
jgi:hypothetical protein